jgi:uncharacterized protein YecE (DUF72 family)
MEFGRVPENELGKIKFKLAADPSFNKKILKGKPAKHSRVYMGCAKWGRPEWVGKIYPLKTREKNFLEHYVKHYNSIELNATHHKLYGPAATKNWAEKAKGREFLFCPKMHRGVSHRGNLNQKNFLLNEFLRGVAAFGEHLGPIFIQVDERFSPKRKDELLSFLRELPGETQFFLEVRHPDWFQKEMMEELVGQLYKMKIGIVITDVAGRRDCAHMYLSVPKTFIRFTGNSLHKTDYTRIDDWVKRIKSWLDQGMQEIYFFMHMHDEATSPELTVYLAEKLNKVCGLKLIVPEFVKENPKTKTST